MSSATSVARSAFSDAAVGSEPMQLGGGRVRAQHGAQRENERPQLLRPRPALVQREVQPGEEPVGERVPQRRLAVEVPVERHRRDAELAREPAHAHRVDALAVGQGQGTIEDRVAAEARLPAAGSERGLRHDHDYTRIALCYLWRQIYAVQEDSMTVTTRPLPPLAATRWTLDPAASTVEFSVRQFWGLSTVHGRFARFEGELEFPSDGAGRAMLYIDAATVETGNRRRDRHLRARDYFDCRRNPLVRFVADAAPAPGGGLRLVGELGAAGRSIALDIIAAVAGDDDRLELAGGVTVDARELGMSWSPVGTLRTPVTLTVRARLQRAA